MTQGKMHLPSKEPQSPGLPKRVSGHDPGSQVTLSFAVLCCGTSLHVSAGSQRPGNSRRDARHMARTLNYPAWAFLIAIAQKFPNDYMRADWSSKHLFRSAQYVELGHLPPALKSSFTVSKASCSLTSRLSSNQALELAEPSLKQGRFKHFQTVHLEIHLKLPWLWV